MIGEGVYLAEWKVYALIFFTEKNDRSIMNKNVCILGMEYMENHIEWFFKNHPDAIVDFLEAVRKNIWLK